MKAAIMALMGLVALSSSPAFAADAAQANMQRAMGGIIQQTAVARGLSTTDPRTYSTLYGLGKAAVAGAAVAGTGVLVGGSAPAWGTILAVAAIGAGVSYAVNLAIDGSVKWAFGGTAATPITSTVTTATSGSGPWKLASGGPCTVANNVADLCVKAGEKDHTFSMCYSSSGFKNPTGACLSNWQSQGYPSPQTTFDGAMASMGFVAPATSSDVTTPNVNISTAISQMTEAQKAKPLAPDTLALMLNHLWKQAASQADYAGMPYTVAQPITGAEVQAWQQANPQAYPSVGSLTTPIGSPTSDFAPSSTTSSSTATEPATSPTASTATNPGSSSPQINIGADPAIGTPSLEATPTAQVIFKPFMDMVLPLKSMQVQAGAGDCPKPTFDVFEKHIQMTSHCDIAEQNRAAITSIMTAVFVLAALFIVFSA